MSLRDPPENRTSNTIRSAARLTAIRNPRGPALLAAVLTTLSAEDVRPLTDQVLVQAAEIVPYTITAALTVYPGPDAATVRAAAAAATTAYAASVHRLGYDVTLSGLYAALHQPGVQRVALTAPAADLVLAAHGVAADDGGGRVVEEVGDCREAGMRMGREDRLAHADRKSVV